MDDEAANYCERRYQQTFIPNIRSPENHVEIVHARKPVSIGETCVSGSQSRLLFCPGGVEPAQCNWNQKFSIELVFVCGVTEKPSRIR